ncbi:MAG: phosphatase PAP2 family protein [Spirochaetia bacterium]|nr:phosphatase PAP2 family protein [Spirochaetia bacterium]
MQAFSVLGVETFYFALVPIIYWFVSRRTAVGLLVILAVSAYLNSVFKWIFSRPRPFWISADVRGMAIENTYGIPSGHAQNAIAVWFVLAVSMSLLFPARKRLLFVIAGVVAFGISFSRIYLGMHFVQDVLLGWLIGGLILAGYIALEKRIDSILTNPLQHAALLVFPFLMIGVALLVRSFSPQPASYPLAGENYDPLHINQVIAVCGTLMGLIVGSYVQIPESKSIWWVRALGFVATLVGIGLISKGLSVVGAGGDLEQPMRFIRYALLVFWGFVLVPWSAKKLLS